MDKLDQIEKQLLEIAQAIGRLSVLERRAAAGEERINSFDERLTGLEKRLEEIYRQEMFQ